MNLVDLYKNKLENLQKFEQDSIASVTIKESFNDVTGTQKDWVTTALTNGQIVVRHKDGTTVYTHNFEFEIAKIVRDHLNQLFEDIPQEKAGGA